jgi:hypothetical protein
MTRGFAAPAFAGCAFVEDGTLACRLVRTLSRQEDASSGYSIRPSPGLLTLLVAPHLEKHGASPGQEPSPLPP